MAEVMNMLACTNWFLGITVMLISSFTISPSDINEIRIERKGWRKYRRGYTIHEIRKMVDLTSDPAIIKKLKRTILIRRIANSLLLSTPILIVLSYFF